MANITNRADGYAALIQVIRDSFIYSVLCSFCGRFRLYTQIELQQDAAGMPYLYIRVRSQDQEPEGFDLFTHFLRLNYWRDDLRSLYERFCRFASNYNQSIHERKY